MRSCNVSGRNPIMNIIPSIGALFILLVLGPMCSYYGIFTRPFLKFRQHNLKGKTISDDVYNNQNPNIREKRLSWGN